MAVKAHRQKKNSNLAIAFVLSLIVFMGIKDAVYVFADALLPVKTITLQIAPCADANVRELTIVYEDKKDEIFDELRKQISSQGTDNILNGWRYTEGEPGVSWTRIQAAEAGDTITITALADPDYYLAVFSDQWSGAFQMRIDEGEPQYIDCYKEITSPDILRIRPFEQDRAHKIIRGVCCLMAVAVLFAMIYVITGHLRSDTSKDSLYPLLLIVACLSVFSMYYLFINQARGFFPSDLPAHIRAAVVTRGYSTSHFMLRVFYKALGYYGCALYLTIVTAGTVFAAGWFIRFLQKMASSGTVMSWTEALLIGFAVCYAGSIFIPNVYPLFYLYHDYTGLGTASSIVTQPWHNSTYSLMRLFGTITLMLYIRIKCKYLESGIRFWEWMAFALALTLTNAAKPNFFIAFAPAMLIVLIYDFIRKKGQGFLRMVVFGSGVLCSMPVLFFQKGSLFPESAVTEEGSAVYGIKVTTRVVEKMWNNGVFRPLLLTGLSFFLIVTVACIVKGSVKEYLVFAWLMLGIALLTSWFVVETGPRENAGNFGWGVPFFAFSLMVICIERLLALKPQLNRSVFVLMLSPLVLMIISGICYYAHLLGGGSFIA